MDKTFVSLAQNWTRGHLTTQPLFCIKGFDISAKQIFVYAADTESPADATAMDTS